MARHDMHMQLRHQIAERADIDLRSSADRHQQSSCPCDLFDQHTAIWFGKVEQFDGIVSTWHKDEPRVTRIVHQQDARKRPIGYGRRVACQARMKRELGHQVVSFTSEPYQTALHFVSRAP